MKWEPETFENITDYKARKKEQIIYLKHITRYIKEHANIYNIDVLAYLKQKISLYSYNLYFIEPLKQKQMRTKRNNKL